MIDQSADPLQVQRRLGHNDIRTTLLYYGHLFPNREDDLNDALEKVYREARDGSLADSLADSRGCARCGEVAN